MRRMEGKALSVIHLFNGMTLKSVSKLVYICASLQWHHEHKEDLQKCKRWRHGYTWSAGELGCFDCFKACFDSGWSLAVGH